MQRRPGNEFRAGPQLGLATAAFAICGAGSALASGSNDTTISATVAQNCTITDPADIDLTSSVNGGSTFNFTCNFGGAGMPLKIGFKSQEGGLKNVDDPVVAGYTITYLANPAFTALSAQPAAVLLSDSSSGAGAINSRAFSVTRTASLPVAGTYSDVLTVSVAP